VNTDVQERIDTRWFQDRLADKQLSQRQLAARLRLDPAAVSLMLRGRRKMSVAEAAEIANYIGVEVDEVLRHAGAHPLYSSLETPRGDTTIVVGQGDVEIPVPLAGGAIANLRLPAVLTKADAQRIAAIVTALAVPD
jgi:transcriptional regulator with XRE-family HTH domain